MAAVFEEKKNAAGEFSTQVDEQLSQASSRIRVHDITFGVLLIAASVLLYAVAMMLLDKYLIFSEWVRQFALLFLLALLAGAAYLTLLRPITRRINPLYAAKQVELTIDDPKNSVTGYVDAQQRSDLNSTVKAALASRAAKAAAEADVNHAVDHRSLLYTGGVAVVLFLVLVVMFFLFRPAQFSSLAKRAFVPFTPTVIQSRTQLVILKPEPAEPTITTGQSITVAVHVGGKVPSADSPERVRLLVRHNLADSNYDELPMVQGETSRDWELRIPDYLVQNGFWYKVAAGDTETPEYRVTVRSLPTFTDFETTYEYPAYLRRKNTTTNDPVLRGYRGTTVTLIAKANRNLQAGEMRIEPSNVVVKGALLPDRPDCLQFVYKLVETGRYRLSFTAINDESIASPFTAMIVVDADQPPQVVINQPEENEYELPANGQITVDGKIGDDFGIDTVTLKLKVVEPAERLLAELPYLNGKSTSFHREKDDTWPTDLDYKGSVDLEKLTKDVAGLPVTLKEGMVLEYWLEATDNCTEPKPNIGKSLVKRVRLGPPTAEEKQKEQLQTEKEQRQNEEQQHQAQQQEQLKNEKRDQKAGDQQPQAGKQNGEKDPAGKSGGEQGKNGEKDPAGKSGGEQGKNGESDPKQPNGKQQPDGKGKDGSGNNAKDPNDLGSGSKDPNQNDGKSETAPEPKSADQKNLEKTAEELQQEIEREQKSGGSGKPNPTPADQDRTDPGESKPQQQAGMGKENTSESKPQPKHGDPMDPMGKDGGAPSESKPQGALEKQEPSTTKPEKPQDGKGEKEAAPSEQRGEPFGAPPGTDKETPKEKQPDPKNPEVKQDPNSGSSAKPATQKKEGDPASPDTGKQDPAAEAGSGAKPMPENTRGAEKPGDPKQGESPTDTKPQQPAAGDAKPDKAPDAGTQKPKPQDDMMGGKGMEAEAKPEGGANEPKGDKATGAAESKPGGEEKPPMGDAGTSKAEDKPDPNPKGGANADNKGQQKQPSAEEMKKLEDAAKNLNSPDPEKKKEAQQTLDRAIGEEKRKELEQLSKDLHSDDKDKRAAAQKKLEQLAKDAKGEKKGGNGESPKLDPQQQKEIAEALENLQGNDPDKKKEAQEKLDKMVGEGARKETEQLLQDLKSDDSSKKEAAQKKLEEMRKQLEAANKPKPKEPSQQEIADIAKKAQELNSKDSKARQAAEEALDEKIGKENREKLQEQMKQQDMGAMPPTDPEELKKMMEEWRQGIGSSPEAKGPMEDDPKNRLKTAEMNLEQFQNEKYRKLIKDKTGWSDAEVDDYLRKYKNYVENLRDDVAKGNKPATAPQPTDPTVPLTTGGGGKVDPTKPGDGSAGVGGPTAAPPGFEEARRKFIEALKKKQP